MHCCSLRASPWTRIFTSLALALAGTSSPAGAEVPTPVLNTVFPPGGQVGTTVSVTLEGLALDDLTGVRFAQSRIGCRKAGEKRLELTIPSDIAPGIYDIRAIGKYGMSGPRAFSIGNRPEAIESEPNDTVDAAMNTPLDKVVNGRLEKPGDIDCYRFSAEAGQRVVLELWSERIDSKLRGVLELCDLLGKRITVSRGQAGTMDPLIDFVVPSDGTYVVKVFDQTFAGGDGLFYRLDLDTGPRPEFAVPRVLESGKTTRVTIYGRNLSTRLPPSLISGAGFSNVTSSTAAQQEFDSIEIDVTPPLSPTLTPLPLAASQAVVQAFPLQLRNGNRPVLLTTTDLAVVTGGPYNQTSRQAQLITVPCEISGCLKRGDQQDWYVFEARKGEVLWLEGFGSRIDSPIDLDIVVLDAEQNPLMRLEDNLENLGGGRFPTHHIDPSGRFVAPADGRYFVMLRNLFGNLDEDPRRVYQLSVRREDPVYHVAAIPRRPDQSTGLNVWRGGREMLEVIAIRDRGMHDAIRISAEDLPPGIHCPDVWIGPGTDRAPLIVSADLHSADYAGAIKLVSRHSVNGGETARPVHGGAMVWPSQPTGWGRLTNEVPLATASIESSLLVNVTPWETRVFDYGTPRVFQNSSIDLSVNVERRNTAKAGAIRLKGVGLPAGMEYQTAVIPADSSKGWISFSVPAALPPGQYTIAVQVDTEIPSGDKPLAVTTFSNAITIQVEAERIRPEVDPLAPRKIARGKTVRIPIRIERKNGFIGKILGELIAPGGVNGLQARGVAFESQLEAAEIQVAAAENAPLGRHPLLRLELVGMWEDRAVCRSTRFIDLEITE